MKQDLNDRAVAHELPADLKDACEPANDAAKLYDLKNPRVRTVQELLQGSLDRAISKEKPKVLTTGNWKLDECTGGIRPGHVWVLGADTNWGKSSWLVAVADENMAKRANVLIVSTEDDESIYADRLMARRSRVKASHLRDRRLDEDETKKVVGVVAEARPDPLFIDARGTPVETLCVKITNAIDKYRINLVMIDYLQEVKTDTKYQDERVKFREIASQLRGVIKAARISGIIASQITVVDGKKTPDKHSIRESRDVSNAAEVVILGYTSDVEVSDPAKHVDIRIGDKVMKVDKAKDGWKNAVGLRWDEYSACFDRQDRPLSAAEELAMSCDFVADNEREDWFP